MADTLPSSKLPSSKTAVLEIEGIKVDVIYSNYGNRVLLLITSLNKLGTLLEVSRDSLLGSGATSSVKTLLGKDDPQIHAFGLAIATRLASPPGIPLLLGVGLKEHSPSVLTALLPKLEEFRTLN